MVRKFKKRKGKAKNSKLSQEEVIQRIKDVHGDMYDLSKMKYINKRIKIELICKTHGSFITRSEQVFRGQGCPRCGEIIVAQKQTLTYKQVIERSNKIHKNKYKYHDVKYSKLKDNLKIECPKHGIFFQVAEAHIRQKQGCPKCSYELTGDLKRKSIDEFIRQANIHHSNKYDYSKAIYKNNRTKLIITCLKHGDFLQEPTNHLNETGCPNCNISYGEEKIKKILLKHNIIFKQQKRFVGLEDKGSLKCDFYLPNFNAVIEFHGRQHYEVVEVWGGMEGFIKGQRRDKIKRDFLKKNNINFLVIHYKSTNIKKLILDCIKLS